MNSKTNKNLSPEEKQQLSHKANRYFAFKLVINALLLLLGVILITAFLRHVQQQSSMERQRQSSDNILSEVIETMDANKRDSANLTKIFHEGNQATLKDLEALLTSGLYDELSSESETRRCEIMEDVRSRSGVQYLLLIDSIGTIKLAPVEGFYGTRLYARRLMSYDNTNLLNQGTVDEDGNVTPVHEKNETGDYYFYSEPLSVGNESYTLIMGTDVAGLEEQLSNLKDVSRILSQTTVDDGGFLFAVNMEDETFLYYNDGEDLTGQSVHDAGLKREALKDGYSGIQTINGQKYYCVSRSDGDQVVVCAVTDTDNMFSSDKYVLFWSVSGFILVMLLCMAYATIVRNDLIRHHTETQRIPLGKKIRFDRTLAIKIFPLMITGVLMIFGISWYIQTLLGISSAVSDSKVALDEVLVRYHESETARSTVTDYYTGHFISKAKLLAYLLEEDPSVLNQETDRYYTDYDDYENDFLKYYYEDDEGNPLACVWQPELLRTMCDDNYFEDVYIYDENGRVIATTAEEWYFILSYEEGSQSYEFRGVLDGKRDELFQDEMDNELGKNCRYVGVAFYYYTTKDENGDTLYVSRHAYEQSLEENYEGNPVTKHRSLLQASLKSDIVAQLLATTDMEYVFSTDILSNGFIVMLQDDADHTVVYSPNAIDIGKAAKTIGMTDKAFSGSYYGFQKMNGQSYFQYVTYDSGYFLATAIPKSELCPYRLTIAGLTAGVSLLLLIILSVTVTLTTEEEEKLYESVNERLHNARENRVFGIRMPSGKMENTVMAEARWDNRHVPWIEKTPDQKLTILMELALGVLIVYILASVAGFRNYFVEDSVIPYILSGEWERGLNIFAFSASALILILTSLVITLLRFPVRLMVSLFGARAETIGHLLLSVVRYGGTLGCVFYCLYMLGLDATSLLASAGILSLVVALGAQTLIKDILAGIFIVFEGEFRVGDIVTVGDFRGQVMDIGLRTTKIIGIADRNIKIFSNSEISGVLNMTKQLSKADVIIGIEYGQDIDYVEEVLRSELPKIKKHHREILHGPEYLGVTELAASSVNLLIRAQCKEADRYAVGMILNKEVLKIFYSNNINVPFNNITVSYLKEKPAEEIEAAPEEPAASQEKEERKES